MNTQFDDSETYDLNITISKFILSVLNRYKKMPKILKKDDKFFSELMDFEKDIDFESDLYSSIKAFKKIVNMKPPLSKEEQEDINEGLRKFHKIFFQLNW